MKIDFSKTFPVAEYYGFRFINQRLVKFTTVTGKSVYLNKVQVINAINYFIGEIHSLSDDLIRGEGMNYTAFKLHDLVPYLYTLINLYLTKRSSLSFRYYNWLPLLTLDRFSHMPFGEEIFFPEK